MFKSRPVQYLGLLLLVVASLAVIFFPIGSRPEETDYTVYFTSSKPWQEFAKDGKTAADLADEALLKAFANEPMPAGRLVIESGDSTDESKSTLASISDKATTQALARDRANRMLTALKSTFSDIELADKTEPSIAALSETPLFTLGQSAVFPIKQVNGKPVPAVKLGLDLQGGVNLVLQVRRALFTYSFDKELPDTTDAHYEFTSQILEALKKADPAIGLDEANVNIAQDQNNILEIRTQAQDKATFDKQIAAINEIMKSVIPGVTFTQASTPQFFLPQNDGSGMGGFDSRALLANMVTIVRSRLCSIST